MQDMNSRMVEIWIDGNKVGEGLYLPIMRQMISSVEVGEQEFELREGEEELGTFVLNPDSMVIFLAGSGKYSYILLPLQEENA